MEIERGKVRTREEIMACFKDGQTIAIGGQAGAYMPWDLLDMLAEGKLEVEFFPMGSFIEKMRDGGAGIGGFLTKTGLGTDMEKGKQIITTSDGERYILEEAIHADVALTRCRRADPLGNLAYHGTGTASHPVMATCADISIVQCDLYCDLNEISPDDVKVPAMYVDMLYTDSREQNHIIGRIKRNQLEGM